MGTLLVAQWFSYIQWPKYTIRGQNMAFSRVKTLLLVPDTSTTFQVSDFHHEPFHQVPHLLQKFCVKDGVYHWVYWDYSCYQDIWYPIRNISPAEADYYSGIYGKPANKLSNNKDGDFEGWKNMAFSGWLPRIWFPGDWCPIACFSV